MNFKKFFSTLLTTSIVFTSLTSPIITKADIINQTSENIVNIQVNQNGRKYIEIPGENFNKEKSTASEDWRYTGTTWGKNYGYVLAGREKAWQWVKRSGISYEVGNKFSISLGIAGFSIASTINMSGGNGYSNMRTRENYKSSLGLFGEAWEKYLHYDVYTRSGHFLRKEVLKNAVIWDPEVMPVYQDKDGWLWYDWNDGVGGPTNWYWAYDKKSSNSSRTYAHINNWK